MTLANPLTADLVIEAERMGENFVQLECDHARAGWVYVLAGNGLVKIGSVRSSETFLRAGPMVALTNRLRNIQAMSPTPLVLLRLFAGGPAYERELHTRFAARRVHGEWFNEIVFGDLEMTGCPKCELVVVPSDVSGEIRAELARLRNSP